MQKNKNAQHLPASQKFNKRIKSDGDVGIWHETYLIPRGSYESVYNNMPRFGLGKAGELIQAKGNYHNAKDRVGVTMINDSEKQTTEKM